MSSEGSKAAESEVAANEDVSNVQLTQVRQLLDRIIQEIEANSPRNVIRFIVDFLCKHYPNHLPGFSTIFSGDADLEFERLSVIEFFKAQKITTDVATHFTNAGYDTLETLAVIKSKELDDIERLNISIGLAPWLPGHKIRLNQIFADVAGRIKVFREEKEFALRGSMQMAAQSMAALPSYQPAQPQYYTVKPTVLQTNQSAKHPLNVPGNPYQYSVIPGNILPPQYTHS